MSGAHIRQIIEDEDFRAVVSSVKKTLTATVMAANSTPEARQRALDEFHALERVLTALGAAATKKE